MTKRNRRPDGGPAAMCALQPQHQALIAGSAISPAVAAARGYRSITTKADLRRLGFSDAQCLAPALAIPLWTVTGEVGGYQIRPDSPRIVEGKPRKYESPTGSQALLDVPPPARACLADPAIPLWVTEGARKADSAVSHSLCCVSIAGVWAWRGRNEFGGKVALPGWEAVALNGREVFLAFDSDVMLKTQVYRALARLGAFLTSRGAQVRYVYLPVGDHGEKVGLDDYLAAGHTKDQLLALATTQLRQPSVRDTSDAHDDPIINVSGRRMHEVSRDALAALERRNAAAPYLFRRGAVPVRLVGDSPALAAEPLTAPALKGELDRCARFVKDDDRTPARPPGDVVNDILALPGVPFPPLEGIIGAPTFLAGGELLDRAGYHAPSGLYLTRHDLDGVHAHLAASDALTLLRDDLLGDFPFADEGSQTHALALLLQFFVRPLIAGPTPLYLIEAPARGTGKGLLADVVSLIALGRHAPVMCLPHDDDELEKRITSVLIEGSPVVLLDNITSLRAAPLAAALTSDEWRGRLLGKSQMLRLRQAATWIATGNNVTLSDELARRVVPIRLDASVERPELRTGFRHDPLTAWVKSNRAELVSACLSLVQRWIDGGRKPGTARLGRFEAWATVLGGILQAAGGEGFLSNRERLYMEADAESDEWRAVCAAWAERYGDRAVTAGELLAIVKADGLLAGLWGGRSDLAGTQRLGHALTARRDRVYGAYRLRRLGRDGRNRNATYAVEMLGARSNTRNTGNTRAGRTGRNPEPAGESSPPRMPEWGQRENTRREATLLAGVLGDSGVSGVSGVLPPPHGDAAVAEALIEDDL